MTLTQDLICFHDCTPPFPSVLCFRSGTLIDSVKSWVRTDKAAAPEDQGPQSRLSQTQLSQSQLSQSQVSQTQLPKVPNEEKGHSTKA